jgi:hypothetical protein
MNDQDFELELLLLFAQGLKLIVAGLDRMIAARKARRARV